jgi:hypothetical protein
MKTYDYNDLNNCGKTFQTNASLLCKYSTIYICNIYKKHYNNNYKLLFNYNSIKDQSHYLSTIKNTLHL